MKSYEIYGDSKRLSEKYVRKQIGIALSQFRFSFNQLIDIGAECPADVNLDYWKVLKQIRESKEGKAKSVKMVNIVKGRSSKNTTKKSVEQSVFLQLVSCFS